MSQDIWNEIYRENNFRSSFELHSFIGFLDGLLQKKSMFYIFIVLVTMLDWCHQFGDFMIVIVLSCWWHFWSDGGICKIVINNSNLSPTVSSKRHQHRCSLTNIWSWKSRYKKGKKAFLIHEFVSVEVAYSRTTFTFDIQKYL